jgi:hypothetical protein
MIARGLTQNLPHAGSIDRGCVATYKIDMKLLSPPSMRIYLELDER